MRLIHPAFVCILNCYVLVSAICAELVDKLEEQRSKELGEKRDKKKKQTEDDEKKKKTGESKSAAESVYSLLTFLHFCSMIFYKMLTCR